MRSGSVASPRDRAHAAGGWRPDRYRSSPRVRQVTMAHDPLVAVCGLKSACLPRKSTTLASIAWAKQSTRPSTQDFGELILDVCWLNQLDDVIFGHCISLLVEASSTPTICRLSDSRRHHLSAIAPRWSPAMTEPNRTENLAPDELGADDLIVSAKMNDVGSSGLARRCGRSHRYPPPPTGLDELLPWNWKIAQQQGPAMLAA